MIPNAQDMVEVSSSIDGEVGQFSVDENSLAKIMSVLTNLYSDPEGAVVREYLTNALDAQIEAQEADPNYTWRPIEVTTPSHFTKEYKVRDFGVGMTVDDLKEIYSKYGKSTKEQSNSVTGMLGLGSKCALTYTGQFTITGYKNGVRTRAVVTKNEDDIPVFMIVDTRATTEPNGVEIAVPVRDRNSFAEKTSKFLRWWKDGQVLVNGREPEKHGYTKVQDSPLTFKAGNKMVTANAEVYLIEREQHSYRYNTPQSYVIMGNVPYAVDAEYVDESLRGAYLGFAAYVPMGAVDFPPSREKLFYNSRSKETVRQVSEGLFESILEEKLKEITDAPDHREAWRRYTSLSHHFSSHPKAQSLKYKGDDFVTRILHNNMELDWDWQGHGQISERTYVNMPSAMSGTLVVTGVTQGTKPTSYFKKKVRHYIEENDIEADDALLVDDDIDSRWLDWVPRVDADTIKAIKLPRGNTVGPRVEATYDWYMLASDGSVASGSDIIVPKSAGKTLAYISPQDIKETYRKHGCQPYELAQRLGEKYIVVVMGKNRFEKFLRTHPGAISVGKAIQNKINEYIAAVTDAEFLVGKLSYGERDFMDKVRPDSLDDPDLAELARTVQNKSFTANYSNAENLHTFSRRASVHTTLPEKKNVSENPCDRYPLLDRVGGRQVNHLVIYVNAVYAAEYAPKP